MDFIARAAREAAVDAATCNGAETGYDEKKTQLLISTNWIRTLAYLVQAALAATIAVRAVSS